MQLEICIPTARDIVIQMDEQNIRFNHEPDVEDIDSAIKFLAKQFERLQGFRAGVIKQKEWSKKH